MFGVSAALTTPFRDDGSVDFSRLNDHIRNVLSEGCSSVTFFGTTGEGSSVDTDMRLETVQQAIDAGIDPGKIVLTLHGTAAGDVVKQAMSALEMGVNKFLLPPPCYFAEPTDDGLYGWFANVLSKFDNTNAKFILYHIPQVIGVALPNQVIAQLKLAFPSTVLGVKDSSGSFENTRELLQLPGLEILVGDERLLAEGVKLGASGAISGLANLFPSQLCQVVASGENNPLLNGLVDIVVSFPVTPAVKALVAYKYGAEEWRRPISPLEAISDETYAVLAKAYDLVGKPT